MSPPKLTVATSFPVFPALGGGQTRVLGLYGALAAAGVAVDVVALVARHERFGIRQLAPGFREIRVPKTLEHEHSEFELGRRLGVPVSDVALLLHHELTPAYVRAIAESAATASAVVACHPFGLPALREAAPSLPLIYEAQDVETDLKADMFAAAGGGDWRDTVAAVRDGEAQACREADHVIVCAQIDGDRLVQLFGNDPARIVVVPNGCECEEIPFIGPEARSAHRTAVGLDAFTALFVGSWHGPNLEAVRAVRDAAEGAPDIHFLVVGSVGLAVANEPTPTNMDLAGPVARGFLRDVLALANVAVNPMASGSGTNLKMLEYAAAGVPLVSSKFGARGLGFTPGEHYAVGEPEQLAEALDAVRNEPQDETVRRLRLAYDRVATTFDWPVIGRRWLEHVAMQRIISS
jgi:glycosyltransferase involved in cell wall biosynthesis